MENADFEEGAIYKINHSRKGSFSLQVTGETEEWLSGLIVEGVAKAMLSYNEREQGETITVRKCFIRSHKKKEK